MVHGWKIPSETTNKCQHHCYFPFSKFNFPANTNHSLLFIVIDHDYNYDSSCYLVGRQHLKQVEFCQCVSDSATLVKLQLWPGSPTKPKVAFHFNLMDLAEKFLLESHVHVSLHKFCSSIEIEYPDMLPKLVCIYYDNLSLFCNSSFLTISHLM